MKKALLSFCLFALLSGGALLAQPYQLGGGLRLGEWYGLQGKMFLSSTKAVEVVVSPVTRGMHLSGLLEVHTGVGDVGGLLAYAGIGPHLGLWTDGRYNPWWYESWNGKDPRSYYNRNGNPEEGRIALGMDMILGIEYKIPTLPLSLALDWKPGVMLLGYPGMIMRDVALSIRFVQ